MSRASLIPAVVLLLACALSAPGCVVLNTDYGDETPDASGIEAGVTTREQVFDMLGPPEEFSWPRPWGGHSDDPQRRRVEVERDLFGRSHYTWLYEERRDRALLIVPIFTIFSHRTTEFDPRRFVVFFDEQGVVSGVGRP